MAARSRALSFSSLSTVSVTGSRPRSRVAPRAPSSRRLRPDATDVIAILPPTGFSPGPDAGCRTSREADHRRHGASQCEGDLRRRRVCGSRAAVPHGAEVGSMFPRNRLRPAVQMDRDRRPKARQRGDAGGTFDALRASPPRRRSKNDLVVSPPNTAWTMPRDVGRGSYLAVEPEDDDDGRGGTLVDGKLTNASAGSESGPLEVAPVDAPGTIVYWTTASSDYFDSGKYNPVLKVSRVGDGPCATSCIPAGCAGHAVREGEVRRVPHVDAGREFTVSSTHRLPRAMARRRSASASSTEAPGFLYVSPSAKTLFDRPYQAAPSLSAGHFRDGDRVAVTMLRLQAGDPFDRSGPTSRRSRPRRAKAGVSSRTGDPTIPRRRA